MPYTGKTKLVRLPSGRKKRVPMRKVTKRPRTAPAKMGLNNLEKKQVKGIIAQRKELKYCERWYNHDHYAAYTQYDLAPILATTVLPNVNSPSNGIVSIIGLQTGEYLNSSSLQLDANLTSAGQTPCMYNLGGFSMPRGDTSTTIDGNEVYFNSGKVTLQINTVNAEANADQVNDAVGPMDFRVIHVKAKKDAAGTTPSISGQLMRNMVNDNAGLMSDMTQRELFHDFSINRQRWTVVNDKRFTLAQPVQPNYAGTSANQPVRNRSYPSQHRCTLYFDKPKKKLRMSEADNGTNNNQEPNNYDYIHSIFVLCTRQQINSSQFSNTAKCWTLTTKGQTTYREA